MTKHSMRALMNLMETEEIPLEGPLDARSLSKMLPDVDDAPRFLSAMSKLRRGEIDSLSPRERSQLAMAFVSLLRSDRDGDMAVMRRLMNVHAAAHDETPES